MRLHDLLEYRDGDRMRAVRIAMERAGLRYLAYGSNALVMQSRNGTVVKVFEPDACYRHFVTLVGRHPDNPHFPRLWGLARLRTGPGKGLWMVKMEDLQPLTSDEYMAATGFHCFAATIIPRHAASLNLSHVLRHEAGDERDRMAAEWAETNPAFATAIRLVAKGMRKGCRDDLHRENLMRRGRTWVIIDPYATR